MYYFTHQRHQKNSFIPVLYRGLQAQKTSFRSERQRAHQTPQTDRELSRSPLRSAPRIYPRRSHCAKSRLTAARHHLQVATSKDSQPFAYSTEYSIYTVYPKLCDVIIPRNRTKLKLFFRTPFDRSDIT